MRDLREASLQGRGVQQAGGGVEVEQDVRTAVIRLEEVADILPDQADFLEVSPVIYDPRLYVSSVVYDQLHLVDRDEHSVEGEHSLRDKLVGYQGEEVLHEERRGDVLHDEFSVGRVDDVRIPLEV